MRPNDWIQLDFNQLGDPIGQSAPRAKSARWRQDEARRPQWARKMRRAERLLVIKMIISLLVSMT